MYLPLFSIQRGGLYGDYKKEQTNFIHFSVSIKSKNNDTKLSGFPETDYGTGRQ